MRVCHRAPPGPSAFQVYNRLASNRAPAIRRATPKVSIRVTQYRTSTISITIGARLACISSFYRFLIRMEIVSRNPCDQLERPKVSPSPPRGLSADDIRRLLAVLPETPSGMRDRAIIVTLARRCAGSSSL